TGAALGGACALKYLCVGLVAGPVLVAMLAAALVRRRWRAVGHVAAVFLTLRKDEETRARFTAVLLATTPAVIYLSRLAMVEMGELFYLVLALLWLREWLAAPAWRTALALGAAAGGACAMKYLGVGLVAGPVLAAMLAWALVRRRWRTLAHVAAAAGVALLLFSPWLVRNTISTGNPVFPLATSVFGRGHWSAQSEQRWLDGHSAQAHPPVPVPPGWQTPTRIPDRMDNLVRNFATFSLFGYVMMFVGGLGLVMMLIDRRGFSAWDFTLAAVLAMQLAVWSAFTRDMPWRFIVLAMAPMCLLAGQALAKLSQVVSNPFRPGSPPPATPWGRVPATAVLIAAAAVNLITAVNLVSAPRLVDGDGALIPPRPVEEMTLLPRAAKPLLIGQGQGFYYPAGTLYATAFDENPLAAMVEKGLTAPEIARQFKARGVTHLIVNWCEIWRLGGTYGYSPILTAGLFDCAQRGLQPDLAVLAGLRAEGMTKADELRLEPRTAPAASPPAKPLTWAPFHPPADWPVFTIYTFPWTPAEALASQPAK
ncbi:MAG: glycosyltransferase family 39 protein, partial [Planctomycetota bacterium]|nr:glycosyltransferase family 39 protein [Planctomycetota bacterium]